MKSVFKKHQQSSKPLGIDVLTNKPFFQPKLTINQPKDVYEQEADTMADKVMRMPDHYARGRYFFKPSLTSIQRKCAECEKEERQQLQRKESNGTEVGANPELDTYVGELSGKGQPLSKDVRNFFEPRMGCDFSNVKVHTDAVAAQSARSIHALAYTTGNNIVFDTGLYTPDTDSGKRLLGHELTHVVQQQSANRSAAIQRQPDKEEKGPKSDLGKAFNENSLFQKLPKFARDKILDEIDNAPETITKAALDKIIDLAPIDNQYKEGLKKVGEAIIKTITGKKNASTSTCDAIPGYHEGTSSTYKGMCCLGTTESEMACCPKDKFAPNNSFSNCCKGDEIVNAEGKCEKLPSIDPSSICLPPGKKDSLGKCCMPPFDVIDGLCTTPPREEPKAQPFSLKFTIGVIDDYNIDEATINNRQRTHFEEVKKQIHQFMEACPASMITITGFADKPGTEEHNMDLGQRRADHMKFLLQLDLIKVNAGGFPPLIFSRSEGENNPADLSSGEKFSAANRRVEIEFNSMCPPLGSGPAAKPFVTPFRLSLH